MRTLGTNDWLVMNHLIYQIHTMEDLTELRNLLLEQMRIFIDFDSADFWLASSDGNNSLTEPVFYNESPQVGETYMENFYSLDYGKGLLLSGRNMIYRESDIISEEERVKTDFYKQYFEPAGWHHGLNLICAYEKKFLGVMAFYRNKGKDNFSYEDIFILEMLKDHLDYRLYRSLIKEESRGKLTFDECVRKYGLTRREETILGLLLDSESNEFICSVLCITNNTLKKHILNLYRKMDVNNRMQLFKIVKMEG